MCGGSIRKSREQRKTDVFLYSRASWYWGPMCMSWSLEKVSCVGLFYKLIDILGIEYAKGMTLYDKFSSNCLLDHTFQTLSFGIARLWQSGLMGPLQQRPEYPPDWIKILWVVWCRILCLLLRMKKLKLRETQGRRGKKCRIRFERRQFCRCCYCFHYKSSICSVPRCSPWVIPQNSNARWPSPNNEFTNPTGPSSDACTKYLPNHQWPFYCCTTVLTKPTASSHP